MACGHLSPGYHPPIYVSAVTLLAARRLDLHPLTRAGLTHSLIRKHPYRWSPAKVEAAKELIVEFIRDGIVTPSVSDWAFPASIRPRMHIMMSSVYSAS